MAIKHHEIFHRRERRSTDSIGFFLSRKLVLVTILSIAVLCILYSLYQHYHLKSDDDSLLNVSFASKIPCPDCNVIFISIDTLRADHLGIYGYFKNTSPAIDSFASDAVVYLNDFSQAPSTLPSHFSMFTSKIPNHTMNIQNPTPAWASAIASNASGDYPFINTSIPTIVDYLRQNSFITHGIVDAGYTSRKTGFGVWFDSYDEINTRSFSSMVNEATRWISAQQNKKFFLFLHTYEVHEPYPVFSGLDDDCVRANLGRHHLYTPQPLNRTGIVLRNIEENLNNTLSVTEMRFLQGCYDAGIRSMDTGFATLVSFLKKNGIYGKTMVIFTADHGDGFAEHGLFNHGNSLYRELLHVPLLIKYPYSIGGGRMIDAYTRGIDIAPTILDVIGSSPVSSFEGESLLPLFNQSLDLYAISEFSLQNNFSIRTQNWTLIVKQLFDVRTDSAERIDVASLYPDVVANLSRIVAEARQKKYSYSMGVVDDVPAVSSQNTSDSDLLEELKALGYIG